LPSPSHLPGQTPGAPAPPTPLRPSTVTVTVEVEPRAAKAKVVLAGRAYHGTTLRLTTPHSAEATKLRVSAPGYRLTELLLVPSADARVRIRLKRLRRRSSTRRRRRPHKKRRKAALLRLPN
jgi:hypothetical protein